MATVSQIVSDLTAKYKADPDAGITLAEAKLNELEQVIDAERLILSNIEGNEFRWASAGKEKADWFTVYTRLKSNLEACKDGRPISGRGFFRPKFNQISL